MVPSTLSLLLASSLTPAVSARPTHSQDPATLLAAMRTALGGEALLDSITSFTVGGSINEYPGPVTISSSAEISLQLPDKFVLVTRRNVEMPGGGFTMTRYNGFNGDVPISATIAPGAPMPVVIPPPPPRTAAEAQARQERGIRSEKDAFVRLVLPLFGVSPAIRPLRFEATGQTTVDKTLTDVITATTADGTVFRLYLDAATHLPVKLAWMAEPIVTFSTSSRVTTNSRGDVISQSPPPGAPPVILPGSLPLVEWTTVFSDYKTEAGLRWPHRFVTSTQGMKANEMRLGKYKVNVPIKPQTFEPRR